VFRPVRAASQINKYERENMSPVRHHGARLKVREIPSRWQQGNRQWMIQRISPWISAAMARRVLRTPRADAPERNAGCFRDAGPTEAASSAPVRPQVRSKPQLDRFLCATTT